MKVEREEVVLQKQCLRGDQDTTLHRAHGNYTTDYRAKWIGNISVDKIAVNFWRLVLGPLKC